MNSQPITPPSESASEEDSDPEQEQSDWLADTDEEIDEQELEAHYNYMAKIQEVPNTDSGTDAEPLEQNDSFAFVHELKQEMHADLKIPKPSVLGKPAPFSNSLERINFAKKKSVSKTNESEGLSKPVTPQNLPKTAMQAVRNTNVIKPGMYRIASSTTQTRAPQLTQTSRNTNPCVSTSTGVAHRTNSVTACNDSLNSRTSNVNAVCATCGKCVFNLNHDACVSKYLNDVNARTKKPTEVPISTRKPKSQANKSVATPHKKTVASESTNQNTKDYNRNSTCFVRDLQGNDLQSYSWTDPQYNLLSRTTSINSIYLMAKASTTQEHGYGIEDFSSQHSTTSTCFQKKMFVIGLPKLNSKGRLNLLYMDLCDPMRVASINGKKYILVIVDDYSRYTWTLFLCSKDETPEVLKDFLMMIQRNLQALVISVRTDRGTKFLNKTLNAFFKEEGIEHQTSTPRAPEQNGVVERRNRTLVEAARTMLSASKLPLFFWAEAIATACYTQNRTIIISTYEKMAYHIINDKKNP
ncbi:retrovirus-related pol polyprotein from transposon TNT 1-94 [Tanacetum coccineum]